MTGDSLSVSGAGNVGIQRVERGAYVHVVVNGIEQRTALTPARLPPPVRGHSPTTAIRARSGMVPMSARPGLLADGRDWLNDVRPFSVAVAQGRGGSGKTRFGVQLCDDADGKGSTWTAGFLHAEAIPQAMDVLAQARTDRLVVIDYAETRLEQLEYLLPYLRSNCSPDSRVRVLLLVRQDVASGILALASDAVRATIDPDYVWPLDADPLPRAERSSLFLTCQSAFAGTVGTATAVDAKEPDLSAPIYGTPLMVVVAAVLAVGGSTLETISQEELLEELLAHESRYWRGLASTRQLDPDTTVARRVTALASLTEPETEEHGAELLRVVPDLRDASTGVRMKWARWLRELYPSDPSRQWGSLEPDLVGEHLVATTFGTWSSVWRDILARDEPANLIRALRVISRAVPGRDEFRRTVVAELEPRLRDLLGLTIAQSRTFSKSDLAAGRPSLAAALATAIDVLDVDPASVQNALRLIPTGQNVVLAQLARVLAPRSAENLRLVRGEEITDAAQARAISTLVIRLSDLGRDLDALPFAIEAVTAWRHLAADAPDVYSHYLAAALLSCGIVQTKTGHWHEGLRNVQEAVAIYQVLVARGETERNELGLALNALANAHHATGDFEQALEVMEESVDLWRELVADGDGAHRGDYAASLVGLANRLWMCDRCKESLRLSREAVDLWRELAEINAAAATPNLGLALFNLVTRLIESELYEEALQASEEVVELYEWLAESNPSAYLHLLGNARAMFAMALAQNGRLDRAIVEGRRALEVLHSRPGGNSHVAALSSARIAANLAGWLLESGDAKGALECSTVAVQGWQEVVHTDPSQADTLGLVCKMHEQILESLGRTQEA